MRFGYREMRRMRMMGANEAFRDCKLFRKVCIEASTCIARNRQEMATTTILRLAILTVQ